MSPTPWAYTYRDYWSSQVTAFEVLDPHHSLTVTGPATVHTDRSPQPGPTMSWEDMRNDTVADVHTEYLAMPERVAPTEDLVVRAGEIADTSANPGEAAREVCALIYRKVKYLSRSTTVDAFAAHSWAERAGVCQDVAQIAIGALRSIGIPCALRGGYLHPMPEPVVGDPVSGESHAWVEWWDDGWRGFDPTNDTEPG